MRSTSSSRLIASPLILQPITSPKHTPSKHIFLTNTTPKTLTLICRIENRPTTNKTTMDNPKPNKPTRTRNPRKSSYGTSRRSIIKKSFSQEQVMFTGPLSDDPIIAIIGGGMSGLVCALNLEKRGIRSTVFDTGLHGLGGRMGTRIIDPQPLIFDHAAQFFTVSDPQFAKLVDGWSEKGQVQQWEGTIGELEVGGRFVPLPSSPPRYIGVNGMRPLADSILSQTRMIDVVRPCWISKLEPCNGMWHLSENGKPRGQFDALVIAHNGKCANRLLASSGLPLIARQMKGLHGLGGRMGTRIIDPQPLIFDHAAQFFTVSDPQFAKLVDGWSEKGQVQQWEGTIGELEVGGRFVPLPSSPPRYIGVNGMRPLADSILSQTRMIDVVRPCWISKLEPCNGMWHLSENGKPRGQFDALVIAHNGKCANRLLASSGLPLIARQMKRLELSSIWALLAAFEDPLPNPANAVTFPFEGAFVKGVDSVSWMANNAKKLLCSQNTGPHCWTFFSTATFGKRNKVPQENIPTATAERVKEAMLEGVENALGLSKSSLKRPFYTRLQLWGAALPTNTPGIPCIFDPHGRAGICGDWLLGSSLEAAAISGIALANHIADYFQSGGARPDEFAVGLHNEFQPLIGHDIGQFPGLESEEQTVMAQSIQLST